MPTQFDSWDSYLWEPGGSVLRNLYGERDGANLAQREYSETNKQQSFIEAGLKPIARTFDAEHVRAIHKQLFGNVYEWAGEYRTVGIQKGVTEFAQPGNIPDYLNGASRLVKAADWSTMNRNQFATAAAEVFAYVNQGHPFREGNGRTSKLFMKQVAELSPYRIIYSPAVSGVTLEMWNQASMLAGPDRGKFEPVPAALVPVFRAMAVERTQAAQSAAPDPARDPARDRSARSASYPRPATEATRQSPQSGPQARRSGPYLPGQNRGTGRGE